MTRDQSSPAARISPTEAIRRAMAALGAGSQVPQILDYIREHYGITGVTEPGDGEPAPEPPARPNDKADMRGPIAHSSSASVPPAKSPPPLGPSPEGPLHDEGDPGTDAARKGQGKRGKPKDRPSL